MNPPTVPLKAQFCINIQDKEIFPVILTTFMSDEQHLITSFLSSGLYLSCTRSYIFGLASFQIFANSSVPCGDKNVA